MRVRSGLVWGGALAVLGVAIGAGCSGTWVDYQPYSAQGSRQQKAVNYAIVAYERDIEALANAGGFIVGSLHVKGNGFAGEGDVAARAQTAGANYSGTHVIFATKSPSVSWAKITPDTATTTYSGNTANTTFRPGTSVPIRRHQAGFVIVRVPVRRWLELPESLRPVTWQALQIPKPELAERHAPQMVKGAPGSSHSSASSAGYLFHLRQRMGVSMR